MRKNTSEDETGRAEYRAALKRLAREVALVTGFLTIFFTFVFGITVQHGNDMYPAIRDGDIVFYYRTHDILNTEAVVCSVGGETCTGRVEAVSGTVISATGDLQMTFDGLYLPISQREGIYTRTYAEENMKLPLTVKENHYFLLGDNRDEARDSRTYGQVNSRNIKGRIVAVLRRRQI